MKKIYVPNEFMFSFCGAPLEHCERFFGRPESRWVDGGEVIARLRVAGRDAVYRSSAPERRCVGWLEVARADCDSVLHALRRGDAPKGSEPPVYVVLSDGDPRTAAARRRDRPSNPFRGGRPNRAPAPGVAKPAGGVYDWAHVRTRGPAPMTTSRVSAVFALLLLGFCAQAFAVTGQLKGGEVYTLPPWFKSSFLDFQADAEEAGDRGRHLMLFMHLDECPYCSRMLDENFFAGDNQSFIRAHFDVIGVNIRGGLEVAWVDGESYTERALARKLRVVATPAIVFLDAEGTRVLQLNGYRDPRALRYALEYVHAGLYREQPFGDYLAGIEKPPVYELRDHPLFSPVNYFKGYREPLAILFEDRGCAECARFHETTLGRPEVMEEMEKFLFVRLDTDSDKPIVDPEGRTVTAAEWARALDLTYRPALALFNEGRLLYRVDGRLYHQHFREALRYAGGAYRDFDSVSAFKAAFRQQQLESGVDVDFGE